jgi:hypothetical protein
MRKSITLLLVLILTISSLMTVKPVFAQSISKPPVPEFTLRLVEHPYNVAPVTEIDPYTGETKIVEEGRYVQNRTIEVIVKNAAFAPYTDANNNQIVLSYNISVKGHFSEDWKYYPNAYWKIPLMPSKADYTVITFGYYNESDPYSYQINIPTTGKLDFRVEQNIGYFTQYRVPVPGEFYSVTFTGESSGWSNTETITIDQNSSTSSPLPSSPIPTASSSQNPAVSPIQPVSGGSMFFGLGWVGVAVVALLAVVVVALLVFVVVYMRRRSPKPL